MAHEEVAISEALGYENTYNKGDKGKLFTAVKVAHGEKALLSEHIETYLSGKSATLKTIGMIRRDLVQFTTKFTFVEDATDPEVRAWANVTLGEEGDLSLATRKRMISACRGIGDTLNLIRD